MDKEKLKNLSSRLWEAAGDIYGVEDELPSSHPLYPKLSKLFKHVAEFAELFEKHTHDDHSTDPSDMINSKKKQ